MNWNLAIFMYLIMGVMFFGNTTLRLIAGTYLLVSLILAIFEIRKKLKVTILIDGAREGDLEEVKKALSKGADIHAKNNDMFGNSDIYAGTGNYDALRLAAKNGHLEIVKHLVEQGADIHARNELAIKLAAENGHLQVVQYLVEAGSDAKIVIDSKYSKEDIKNWARRYINAKEMAEKLEANLQPKTTTKTGRIKI